jgi:hypothetical protein
LSVASFAKSARAILRVLIVAAFLFVVLIAVMTAVVDLIRHRSAQHFLTALRTVKVGTTIGSEALAIGQRFNAKTYVFEHAELPSGFSDRIVDVPPSACLSGNCFISFGADANARWMEAISYSLLRWDAIRRWIPANAIVADITVEHGIVTDLEVEQASLQQEDYQQARTMISSKTLASPWNIRRYTAHITGGPGRHAPTVELKFNPSSQHPNQESALNFNLKCLRFGRSCSTCEMLPGVCEDDEHGNWFYFEMPPELLKDFQAAVNHLKLGSTQDHVVKIIGSGGLTSQRLFDDRLPYRFPEDTMFTDQEPESLIYYVKKWRQYEERDNSKDQTVTFVFDSQDRLVRVDSKADGIPSIP